MAIPVGPPPSFVQHSSIQVITWIPRLHGSQSRPQCLILIFTKVGFNIIPNIYKLLIYFILSFLIYFHTFFRKIPFSIFSFLGINNQSSNITPICHFKYVLGNVIIMFRISCRIKVHYMNVIW